MRTSWRPRHSKKCPKRVRVVADVDRDDRVVGHDVAERLEHERRVQAAVRVGEVAAPRLLRPPALPAVGDHLAPAGVGRRPGSAAVSSSRVRAMSPHSGTSTGWNLPRIMRSRSTWIVGTQVGIDVWLENEAPSTSRQSASATVWLATGMPGAAEHAAPERVVVGHRALGLERGDHRRVEVLGERPRPRRGGRGRRCR